MRRQLSSGRMHDQRWRSPAWTGRRSGIGRPRDTRVTCSRQLSPVDQEVLGRLRQAIRDVPCPAEQRNEARCEMSPLRRPEARPGEAQAAVEFSGWQYRGCPQQTGDLLIWLRAQIAAGPPGSSRCTTGTNPENCWRTTRTAAQWIACGDRGICGFRPRLFIVYCCSAMRYRFWGYCRVGRSPAERLSARSSRREICRTSCRFSLSGLCCPIAPDRSR